MQVTSPPAPGCLLPSQPTSRPLGGSTFYREPRPSLAGATPHSTMSPSATSSQKPSSHAPHLVQRWSSARNGALWAGTPRPPLSRSRPCPTKHSDQAGALPSLAAHQPRPCTRPVCTWHAQRTGSDTPASIRTRAQGTPGRAHLRAAPPEPSLPSPHTQVTHALPGCRSLMPSPPPSLQQAPKLLFAASACWRVCQAVSMATHLGSDGNRRVQGRLSPQRGRGSRSLPSGSQAGKGGVVRCGDSPPKP